LGTHLQQLGVKVGALQVMRIVPPALDVVNYLLAAQPPLYGFAIVGKHFGQRGGPTAAAYNSYLHNLTIFLGMVRLGEKHEPQATTAVFCGAPQRVPQSAGNKQQVYCYFAKSNTDEGVKKTTVGVVFYCGTMRVPKPRAGKICGAGQHTPSCR
jgi:hypothetical protein